MSGPEPGGAPRERLALALDLDDLAAALRLAGDLSPWFAVAKVGLELYSAAGPEAVRSLGELGYEVFCDLKLHDIPNTVERAARVIGSLGARYLTLHTSGGVAMLQAGVDGLREGAALAGPSTPVALGVTVLTSEAAAPAELLRERIGAARLAGCGGLVCAASDLSLARELAPEMVKVVPGIRLAGADLGDQVRVATPRDALEAGADLLVIGRQVTRAPDPRSAAEEISATLR